MDYKLLISKFLIKSVILLSITVASHDSISNWFGPEITVIQKVYDDCQDSTDFSGCLKLKALSALGRAIDQESISIFDGVTLTKQNNTNMDQTPSIMDGRSLSDLSEIDRSLLEKLDTFLRSHIVKMDMSEGRKKDKGNGSQYAIAAFLTAIGLAAPIGLKAIGVIAGKALIISKVALTIAGIIALKKLFTNDHKHHDEVEVHSMEHNRRTVFNNRPVVGTTYQNPYRYYHEQYQPMY